MPSTCTIFPNDSQTTHPTLDLGEKISVTRFNVDNSTTISATITIDSSASRGPRDVSVTTPRGTDILENGFVVTRGPLPVWIWVVAGLTGVVLLGALLLFVVRRGPHGKRN